MSANEFDVRRLRKRADESEASLERLRGLAHDYREVVDLLRENHETLGILIAEILDGRVTVVTPDGWRERAREALNRAAQFSFRLPHKVIGNTKGAR